MKRALIAVVLLTALTLVGCTGLYSRLPRASEVQEYAQLERQAEALPWKMHRVAVLPTDGKPLTIAVYDNQQFSAKETVVLIHGMTADNWSYHYMRGALTDYRLIAVDLPGCGLSDAPDLSDMGPEGYSPTGLARCVLQALRIHLAEFPADRISIVGHSLGGTVVLRMFGADDLRTQYQDILARAKSVALYAPAHMAIHEMSEPIRKAAAVQEWQIALAHLLGMIPDLAAGIIRDGMEFEESAIVEMADEETKFLLNPARVRAMKWMLDSAIPSQDNRIDWSGSEYWVRQYRQVQVPCLLVWGTHDTVLDRSIGYEMQHQIPNARLRIINRAQHSLLLEQPRLCAQLLRDFLENRLGPQDVAEVTAEAPEWVRPFAPAPVTLRPENAPYIAKQ
jgi:abhydrolase domain-containing protein 6